MADRSTTDFTPIPVDVDHLRREVQTKYRDVAHQPAGEYHFHTGRRAAEHCGYPPELLDGVPEDVVEAFAGVAYPFHWGLPQTGQRVLDVGSGTGMDAVIAARAVGPEGRVVGVDMTPEMLERAGRTAGRSGFDHLEFRHGLAEELPVPDGWADLVISNGVMNLVPDKTAALGEIRRVLRSGGRLQMADICVEHPVPEGAKADIDLWTG